MSQPLISNKFYVVLIVIFTIVFFNCCKDNYKEMLIGSWERVYEASDTVFQVSLTFNDDDTFVWEMIDSVPTHSNSSGEYTATDAQFELLSDKDCDNKGIYSYSFVDDRLVIGVIDDDCSERIPAFSGVWEEYNP